MMTSDHVIDTAKTWLGTPYLHQASTKGIGCDCLGLILGVGRELGVVLPKTIPAYSANWRDPVSGEQLERMADRHLKRQRPGEAAPGDILLFRMRRDLPAKHCAILIAPDQMIHAQEGVGTIQLAYDIPWQRRLVARYNFSI